MLARMSGLAAVLPRILALIWTGLPDLISVVRTADCFSASTLQQREHEREQTAVFSECLLQTWQLLSQLLSPIIALHER